MSNYYRITAYYPAEDFCFIVDSYGRFERLWEFSSYLVSKGIKILEVTNSDTFMDGNIRRAKEHPEFLFLQAIGKGQPIIANTTIDGITYRSVEICGRRYVPNRNEVIG